MNIRRFNESDNNQKNDDQIPVNFISRETLRKIIEFGCWEDRRGDVYGLGYGKAISYLGDMDKLIDDAIKIIKENDNTNLS